MFNVTDINGKSFEFSLEQLQDMNSSIFNSQPHKTSTDVDLKDHVVQVFNEDGVELGKVGDISSVTDSSGNLPKALKVSIETTHSGDNHNYAIYHSDSMEKDASTFMAPYRKPLIKNHDSRTEPLGRVSDSVFKESDICPDRDTILTDFIVNDKDAIEKFLDGRYRTVSIGGSVGHIKCNICGKDVLKDKKVKFCGHWKGEKYGDNVALWHMRDIKYNECSIVNNPADDWAQVVKIVALSDDSSKDENQDKGIIPPTKDDSSQQQIEDSNEEASIIDNLLEDDVTVPEDGVVVNNDEKDDYNENIEDEHIEDAIDYKLLYDDVMASLVETKDSLSDKEAELETMKLSKEDVEKSFDEEKTKCEEFRSVSLKLANVNKKLLVDKVLLLNNLDLSDSKRVELSKMTAKELNNTIDELISNKVSRRAEIPKIANSALVNNNDNYSINEDDDEVKVNKSNDNDESSTKKTTVIDSIINNLCK